MFPPEFAAAITLSLFHICVFSGEMMRRKRILAGLAAMVCAIALLSQGAGAQWSTPRVLDTLDWPAEGGRSIAVARDGTTVIAWAARNATYPHQSEVHEAVLHLRRISPAGRLGPLRTVHGPIEGTIAEVSVAVDDDGDVLVAWQEHEKGRSLAWEVWARRLSRSGSFGPVLRLSLPGVDNRVFPQAAVGPRGRGAVLFGETMYPSYDQRQVLHRISLTSRVGPAIHLAAPGMHGTHLRATRDGDLLTAGVTSTGVVRAYRLTPDGRMRSRDLSGATARPDSPVSVGADRAGNGYFVYLSEYGVGRNPVAWARRWNRSGTASSPHRISPLAHEVSGVVGVTDMQGDTIITWFNVPSTGTRPPVFSRIWRHGGSLGAISAVGKLPEPSALASWRPSVAVDDDGDGLVVWPSKPEGEPMKAWMRRIRRDGSLGSPHVIPGMQQQRALAITPAGRARVALLTHQLPRRMVLLTDP